jgi:UDP-glucose 4-epimerase
LIPKKKILIVGGTGFIGYHLAKKSLKKGWNVTSVSSKSPKKIRFLPRVKYIICNILNKASLKKKIKKDFDYVVNLGGYVNHSEKKKTFKSHYLGCQNLVKIFLNTKIKSFVQMGSSIEYGNSKSPHKENVKCYPDSLKSTYGKAKLLSSIYLGNIFKKEGFPSTVLRLYLAYGPRQDLNRLLPITIKGCLENKKFPCSAGKQYKDFIHVEDVVDAIIKSLMNKNARGQIINIGSGKPKKIKKVIEYIKKVSGGGYPQFGKIKLRKDEIQKFYPNVLKAKSKINWVPKISFEKGVKSTIKFYKENAI